MAKYFIIGFRQGPKEASGFCLVIELYRILLIFTCSKSTIKTLEKGMKYVQS